MTGHTFGFPLRRRRARGQIRSIAIVLALVGGACIGMAPIAATAQTSVWTGAFSGNYNDLNNWAPNSVPNSAGEDAVLNDTGAGQVVVDLGGGTVAPDTLTFDQATAYTLQNGTLNLATGLTNTSSVNQTIQAIIGSGTVTQAGTGTLTLSAAQRIADTSALVVNGGVFNLNNFEETIASLSGTGGTITTGGTSGGLIVNQAGNTAFAGNWSGASSAIGNTVLEKNGAGTLTLSGTSTITGTGRVIIFDGRIAAAGGNAIGDNQFISIVGTGQFEAQADETIGQIDTAANASILLNGGSITLVDDGNGATQFVSNILGAVSGTGGIVVNDATANTANLAYTLNLSGTNTFLGDLRIASGLVQVSNGAALADTVAVTLDADARARFRVQNSETIGSLASGAGTTVTIDAGQNLTTNGTGASTTVAGSLAGTGTVTKAGAGVLTLAGDNLLYTGGIIVDQGTLSLATTASAGNGGMAIQTNGSIIDYANAVNSAAPITVNSDTTQLQVLVGAANQTGVISEAGGARRIEKIGAGTLTLSAANTFTGATVVSGGTLDITGSVASTVATGNNAGIIQVDGASLDDNAAVTLNDTSGLVLAGSETIGSLAGATGASVTLGANTLTTGGNGASTTYAGSATGAGGGIVKTGAGIFTLSGDASGVTGTSTVNAGTLLVNGPGALGGTVQVAAGATLGGTGTVGGNVTIAGELSAGTSPGTLAVGGDLALAAGSTSTFELNTAGQVNSNDPVTGNDLVTVGGNLTVDGTLALTRTGGGAVVSGFYTLFQTTGTTGGNFATVTNNGIVTADVTQIVTNGGNAPSDFNILVQNGGQLVQFWDGTDTNADNTVDGGTATWNATTTNWTTNTGAINDQWRSQVGVFAGTAGTVTVAGTQDFEGLQFTVNGYTLTGGTLNATGDTNGNAGASFLNADAGTATTISSVISGNVGIGIDKLGAGTVTLSGANTFAGPLAILAGRLNAAGGAAIGDGVTVTVAGGGTLGLDNDETIGSLAGAGATDLAGNTLTVGANNASTTFSGTISGSAGSALVKTGTGTTTLSGANTYAGSTTVTGGTLALAGAGTLGSTVNAFNVAGGTVDLGGTSQTQATLNLAAGTLANGTLNATNSTNQSGGTVAANATIVTGSATQSAGTMAGTATVAGRFALSGGTVSGTATAGSVLQSGGAITGTANTPLFGQTGGDRTGAAAATGSAIDVTAIGGTITAFDTSGVAATNASGNGVTVRTFAPGGAITSVGTGITAKSAAGTVTVDAAANITGRGGKGIEVDAPSGTVDIRAGASVTGGAPTGGLAILSGTFASTNAGTLNGFSVGGGTSTFSNTGLLTGSIRSEAGTTLTITNQAGGRVLLDTGVTATFAGTDNIRNDGSFETSGNTLLDGLETFTSAGIVTMRNGGSSDSLTTTGTFAALAGSSLAVDVDVSRPTGAAGPRADTLTVAALDIPGTAFIDFSHVGGAPVLLETPIQVVNAATRSGAGTFQARGLSVPGSPVGYELVEDSPGHFVIRSTFDSAGVGGIASALVASRSLLQSAALRPDRQGSPWPRGDRDAGPRRGLWAHAIGGVAEADIGSTVRLPDGQIVNANADIDLTHGGVKAGADTVAFDVAGTGADLTIGIYGSYLTGHADRSDFDADTAFSALGIGAYLDLAKDWFLADAALLYQHVGFDLSAPALGLGDEFDGSAIFGSVSAGAALAIGPFGFSPSVGIDYARIETEAIEFGTDTTVLHTLDFDTTTTVTGFASATLDRVIVLKDGRTTLAPFVKGAIYHQAGDRADGRFRTANGPDVRVEVDARGTYGEVGVGAGLGHRFAGQSARLDAQVRADVEFESDIRGAAARGEIRLTW